MSRYSCGAVSKEHSSDEVVIRFLFLLTVDFSFTGNYNISLIFIMGVMVYHMSPLWDHLGLRELG